MRLSRTDFHHGFYVLATGLLLAFLPLSHFAMGLITFLLLLNWIAEWNWREKGMRIRENWQGLLFSALYIVMCVGLIKTDNWQEAGRQMLGNLVFLFAPIIVISSKPFSGKEIRWLLNAFIIGTLIGVVCSLVFWLKNDVREIRQISIFIDHIRFSLCIVLSIVFSVKLMIEKSNTGDLVRLAYAANVLLLTVYMFISQTLTGVVILVLIMVFALFYLLLKRHILEKKSAILALVFLLVAFSVYVAGITYRYFHDRDVQVESLTTAKGNPYEFANDGFVENGHRVHDYICRPEMAEAWALRSDTSYSVMIEATLIRYLNSKGLHKDYEAVMSLSDKDIRHVERKIANVDYTKPFGLKRALYQTYFCISKYRLNQDIQESSLMQRLELWKASWKVVENNWLLGVGLGDQKAELDRQLEIMQSPIAHKHNRGCHNQFLSYWLTGGVILVVYFLFLLAFPIVGMKQRPSFTVIILILTLFCSMLVEDTVDSQTGRMLYAILLPILLFNEKSGMSAKATEA